MANFLRSFKHFFFASKLNELCLLSVSDFKYGPIAVALSILTKNSSFSFRFKQNRQRAGFINGNPLYPVPSSWSPIDPAEEFKVVDLDEVSHSEEFLKVKAQFMTTMASFKVKCIKRVQNPGLWEDYERYMVVFVEVD